MRIGGVVFGIVLLASLASAQTKPERVLTTEKRMVVYLEVGKPTSVVMPEPIAFVGVLIRPDLYSINWHGPFLYLHPFDPTVDSQLFVVGASGEQHTLFFQVRAPADIVVRIAPPRPKAPPAQPVTLATWFRALRDSKLLPGQSAIDVPSPDTRGDARLAVQRLSAVAHGSTIGMVLTVQNLSETPLALDLAAPAGGVVTSSASLNVHQWVWPPKLHVSGMAFDPDAPRMIEPGMTQRLYVVLERRGA